MRYNPVVPRVHTLSARTFLRIEWSSGWSIFIRQVLIPLALLAGLLWSRTAGHLDAILKQLLN